MEHFEAQQKLNDTFQLINSKTDSMHSALLANSRNAYTKKWGSKMSGAKEAILKNSINEVSRFLLSKGVTREAIKSATQDISRVDNPLAMLFNLMSILIPNFAYTEVCGVQPMPTKSSPIFYPQITANDDRNGITKGTALLGSTNWVKQNTYSTNKSSGNLTVDGSGTSATFTASDGSIMPNSVFITVKDSAGDIIGETSDNGKGTIVPILGVITSGTVNYNTGAVTLVLESGVVNSGSVSYRWDFSKGGTDGNGVKPAQIVFEWLSKLIEAYPYRLRSMYHLDNFYQAKQVLGGYDIDQVLATSLGGLINKEISGNVFNEMLEKTDATVAWLSTTPSGVADIAHDMSVLKALIETSNQLRKQIARSGGNYIVAGDKLMNIIESLSANFYNSKEVWQGNNYNSEPIGPYLAGKLLGKFNVIKNQDYPEDVALMGYKKDETDASYLVGVYIGLYSTEPIAKDDLTVVQGMGCQMGSVKAFDNSLIQFKIAS